MQFNLAKITFVFYFLLLYSFGQNHSKYDLDRAISQFKPSNNYTLDLSVWFNIRNKFYAFRSDTVFSKIDYNIFLNYYYLEKFDIGIKYLESSTVNLIKNRHFFKNNKLLIENYFFLGQSYLKIDNNVRAILNYEKCLSEIKRSRTFENMYPLIYTDLADIYYKRGDYLKAIACSEKGHFFGINYHEPRYANHNLYIGCLSKIKIGHTIEAEKIINELITHTTLGNINDYDLGSYYATKGQILGLKKQTKEAVFLYNKALKIISNAEDFPDLGQIYYEAGLMHLENKNYLTAKSSILKSIKFFSTNRDASKANNVLAKIENNLKNFHEAKIYYCRAYILNNKRFTTISKDDYFDLLLNMSSFYRKQEINGRLAVSLFILADRLVDLMRQEHTRNLSKYYWRDKTRLLYENAIETSFLLKDYEKAYYFMEKSRAVMLNDKLNELGAKQKLNDVEQEKERKYQRDIIELNAKIEAETKATEKEKLNSQLFDLQEQQERFVKSLETKYPAYYQLKYNTQIGTLKQMQTYLKTNFKDKNATMVSYFFGDSASYAMVISPNRAEVKQFKYDVAQNQEFVNLLATNQGTKADYARILSMGSVIYQKLIKPLNLPKGHLIISQDGVFMPFEALSSSANSAHYLLKDYAISYTYSGQFLLKKQVETKFWPNQTFVGFAPIEFKNQLNTLKNSDLTLGNVAKNYWFSDTFTGKVATKANFLQQAKDHKIVQIFTHAFADSVDTEPKIYFADQALKISDLNAEDQFNTQLLVLSACKTGVGKLAKGEGVLSLARGFSMLGIPATITSLWSVEDKNTYQLTEFFYKYLNEGQSKDQALQNAKMDFLKLHPNSSPSDWAGMVLVGESSELNNDLRNRIALGALGIISILGAGFYFKRKRQAA